MVIIVFRSRQRAGLEAEALAKGTRMYTLATAMPGFISYKDFSSEDGETVSIVEFADHETLAAWRDHPEHRAVQAWGREHLFTEYSISVCDVVRVSKL